MAPSNELNQILDEIEANRALSDILRSHALLVKALRRAMEYLDWALASDPGIIEHRKRDIAAILNQDEKREKDLGKRGATP